VKRLIRYKYLLGICQPSLPGVRIQYQAELDSIRVGSCYVLQLSLDRLRLEVAESIYETYIQPLIDEESLQVIAWQSGDPENASIVESTESFIIYNRRDFEELPMKWQPVNSNPFEEEETALENLFRSTPQVSFASIYPASAIWKGSASLNLYQYSSNLIKAMGMSILPASFAYTVIWSILNETEIVLEPNPPQIPPSAPEETPGLSQANKTPSLPTSDKSSTQIQTLLPHYDSEPLPETPNDLALPNQLATQATPTAGQPAQVITSLFQNSVYTLLEDRFEVSNLDMTRLSWTNLDNPTNSKTTSDLAVPQSVHVSFMSRSSDLSNDFLPTAPNSNPPKPSLIDPPSPIEASVTNSPVLTPKLPSPIDPPEPIPTIPTPTPDNITINLDGDGGQKLWVITPSTQPTSFVINNFGGVGEGSMPSESVRREVDTIKLLVPGATARNLLIDRRDGNLILSFAENSLIEFVLPNFTLENLDNLNTKPVSGVDPIWGIGNILFTGDFSIQDSIDVFNRDWDLSQVLGKNKVTFLNDLNNNIQGFENSNDVINGQGGDDTIMGLSGDDILRGGSGNDTLWGGTGNNQLYGGSGTDCFGISRNGFSQVLDFNVQEDKIILSSDIEVRDLAIENIPSGNGSLIRYRGSGEILMEITGMRADQLTSNIFERIHYPPLGSNR
jgi:hypothetical protein